MASNPRRIVITGMGLISPIGNHRDQLWDAISEQKSGIAPLQNLPADELPSKIGGEADQFTGHIDDFGPLEKQLKRTIKKGLKVMCREIEMGVAAAQLALTDAGLEPGSYDPDRIGSVYGSDYIMTLPEEFSAGIQKCRQEDGAFQFQQWAEHGLPQVAPLWLLKYLPNMPASHIAIYNDLRGPSNSITLREASANLAIGEAYTTLQRGAADIMVTGATGTRVHALRSVHVILQEEVAPGDGDPAKSCRPFDLHRQGMVMGEGAGAIILENLESAQARGATILAEVVGCGSSAVIDDQGVAQYRTSLENVIRQGLRSAGIAPEDVGHVHAHGLSTQRCDREEAEAIQQVFGQCSAPVPVTAAKSYMGNLGAGSGVVEFIASVESLHRNALFPILNYETPDPACPIHAVTEFGSPAGDSFINLNVTPQGQASSLTVKRFAD